MNRSTPRVTLHRTLPLFIAACVAGFSAASGDGGALPPRPRTPAPAATSTPVPLASATPAPPAAPAKPGMKKVSELIAKQDPPVINQDLMKTATPDNTHVIVSLSKQRAYLYQDDQIVIDTPVSTGKRAGMTPSGKFTVLEKDPNHKSNIFGNFVDSKGRVVRGGISLKIDSAPSGTHYEGAPMLWFMRLTDDGVGMHVGILPGYPASHGCVRMPSDIAPLFYQRVKIGTAVEIDP